ncbi:hypothetical protein GCM10023093_17220 [Nemorincola caseinilytica]|uniref:Secretion system C-terminal sorting domain-containing protein n=1 Tax=Nemorincola caseinilytica TaxID=2054315 RepID=A0ABP8ND89_9BACT
MRPLFSLLLCFLCLSAYSNNATFNKLAEVNKCWQEQPDVNADALPAYVSRTDREWIRTHLALVEATLRRRDMRHLTPAQQRNRMQSLDDLHVYWQTGNFPVNDLYSYRTPIFIDRYDNFCAVGYLVKASGYEHVSRMIAAKTNLAYVRQMNYPELTAWAGDRGFTADELAWIQPGYPPAAGCGKIGEGVNGVVNELYADEAEGRLYVGGDFSQVDGSIAATGIAYVTDAGGTYTWHSMAAGLNGTVYAIAKYSGKIFAAGNFSMPDGMHSVAWWDGSAWQPAGCLNGEVRDLVVFEGTLYACGTLDDCTGLFAMQYFARWDGTAWSSINGPMGRINTMEVVGSSLVLGGAFSYMGTPVNVIKWSPSTSFVPYSKGLNNEVADLEVYGDTLYAACKRTHATDTTSLLMKMKGDSWVQGFAYTNTMSMFQPYGGAQDILTLCGETDNLNMGGQFQVLPMIGTWARNCYTLEDHDKWVVVDSTVNKMIVYKGQLIVGGAFKTGNGGGWSPNVATNGIARRVSPGVSAPAIPDAAQGMSVYPQPVKRGAQLLLNGNFKAERYMLNDMTGRGVAMGNVSNAQQVALPQVPAGMYLLTVSNERGERSVKKIVIE